MKKNYWLVKSKALILSFTLSLTALVTTAQICGPIVEDFNSTSGSTAGFTGDFVLGTANTGSPALVKTSVIGTAIYVVTTPTFQLPVSANSLGYGFILNGSERVARVDAAVMYISTLNGQMTTIFLSQFVPSYNPGTPPTADVCRAIATSDLPGFPAGGSYRFQFRLTPITGNGSAAESISFDDFRTNGTRAQAPLPVNFIGLDARKVSTGAQLNWKIAGEENVNRYEVERSTDGLNFTKIASFARTGKDSYNYLDATAAGTVYYRVKNVDNDGKFKYSPVARIVNGRSTIVLKAFPLPVQNTLTVQHPNVNGTGLITVSTAEGRQVRSVRPANNTLQTFVDMANLQKGLYLIRFDAGDGNAETMKIIKQ